MADDSILGRLPEAQNEHIFRSEILPDYLPDEIGKAAHPTLIVLGGQPGSGKTALLTASHADLEQSGPVIRIVGDDLRSYHTGFVAYQTANPVTASRFTQADAGIWTEKLLKAATERGVHVVFETTMRTPENVERITSIGRDAGYRIEARVLAVNPRVSWQGCHYRFEELTHAGGAARILPRSVHDNAVSGLAESLERMERGRLADRILIETAIGERVYDNGLENGSWRAVATSRQVLEEARSAPLSRDEISHFANIWEKVLSRMTERGAPATLIDQINAQSRDDLAWLAAKRRGTDSAVDAASVREAARRNDRGLAASIADRGDTPARAPSSANRERLAKSHDQNVRPGGVLIPGRELPDLGEAEIDRKLKESSRLAEKRAEIDRLSQLVYGNSAAITTTIEGIGGTMAGSVAGQDVRAGKLGPMAGEASGFLRAESPKRQTAKAHLPQLAAALEDYGRTVDFERHQIETRHREEQHRHRQEIRAPSESLSAILHAPAHEQASRLNASPGTRRELEQIMTAINRRLGPDDYRVLRASDADRLARSLGTSRDRAIALARLHAQTQIVGRQVQMQRQQLDRNSSLAIKR